MNENQGPISQTKEEVEKLIELRISKFKLQATDALAKLFNRIFVTFLIVTLISLLIAFLAMAGAMWIGELTGSIALGMVISSLVVLLLILYLFLRKDKLFINSMTKLFIKLLFPDDKTE